MQVEVCSKVCVIHKCKKDHKKIYIGSLLKERFIRPKKLLLIEKAVKKFLITVENIKMNDIEKILCQIGQSKELPPLLFDSGVDLGTFLSPRIAEMYTIRSNPF